jgi:hypothetical protein
MTCAPWCSPTVMSSGARPRSESPSTSRPSGPAATCSPSPRSARGLDVGAPRALTRRGRIAPAPARPAGHRSTRPPPRSRCGSSRPGQDLRRRVLPELLAVPEQGGALVPAVPGRCRCPGRLIDPCSPFSVVTEVLSARSVAASAATDAGVSAPAHDPRAPGRRRRRPRSWPRRRQLQCRFRPSPGRRPSSGCSACRTASGPRGRSRRPPLGTAHISWRTTFPNLREPALVSQQSHLPTSTHQMSVLRTRRTRRQALWASEGVGHAAPSFPTPAVERLGDGRSE